MSAYYFLCVNCSLPFALYTGSFRPYLEVSHYGGQICVSLATWLLLLWKYICFYYFHPKPLLVLSCDLQLIRSFHFVQCTSFELRVELASPGCELPLKYCSSRQLSSKDSKCMTSGCLGIRWQLLRHCNIGNEPSFLFTAL